MVGLAVPCLPVAADTAATPLSSLQGTTVSADSTYSISSKEELLKFAGLCTEENNWCAGVKFVITDDIDLNEGWTASAEAPTGAGAVTWTPIKMFSGVLDGQGHTVEGFYIKDGLDYKPIVGQTGSEYASGIFCTLSGTTCAVKNLNIENSYIHSKQFVGTVVGITAWGKDNNGLTISNVSSSATVVSDDMFAGGIAGVINGTGPVYIDDCSFSGTVSGKNYVAGIVARTWKPLVVTDCVNTGTIYGNNANGSTVSGILAYYSGGDDKLTMERCVNKGAVYSDTATKNVIAGGIVGFSSNALSIKDCVNTGSVELRRSTSTKSTLVTGCKLGGIIGHVSQMTSTKPVSLTNCASLGTVMFNPCDDKTKNEAGNAIGGLIGDTSYTLTGTENSTTVYYEGAPLSLTDCVVSGTIGGGRATCGGLIGSCPTVNGTITRCVFLGDFDGGNYFYSGGFIGNVIHKHQTNHTGKLVFTDCYYASQSFTQYDNNSVIGLNAVGSYVDANVCKRNIDVCITGTQDPYSVTCSNLSGTVQENFNALNAPFKSAGSAKTDTLTGSGASTALSAFDFESTWTTLADIPMPSTAAALIKVGDVPAIGDDNVTDGGNTGDSTGDGGTGNGSTDSGNTGGTINKLPDTFDPSMIIGGANKPSNDTSVDSESANGESDVQSGTESSEPDAENKGASAQTILAIVFGTLSVLSLALNIVLICKLVTKTKKERKDNI